MLKTIKKVFFLFPTKDRWKFILLFVLMLFASFLEMLGIGLIPVFLSALAVPDAVWNYPYIGEFLLAVGITTQRSLIVVGAVSLISVYLLKNLYLTWYTWVKQKFVAGRNVWLQNRLFYSYMTAPYSFYIQRNSAELLRNVGSQVNNIIYGTLIPILELVLRLCITVLILMTLLTLQPLITVAAVIFFGGGTMFFLVYTRKKMEEFGSINFQASEGMNRAVIQGLGGFKDARVLKRESVFLDEYDHYAEKAKQARVNKHVIDSLPKPMIETLMVTGILGITFILIAQGRSFENFIPILALFGASAVKLMPAVYGIISKLTDLRYNAVSVHAISRDIELLNSKYKNLREDMLRPVDRMELHKEIHLENIRHSYPDSDSYAVDGINLTIKKGDVLAFVGPSGAGKTTLVDIILGLLEPDEGRVLVDGKDINENINGWMTNIGYIPQSIYLLDDTIRRNITFGIPDSEIDEDQLKSAIKMAQLEELVNDLPKGEMTVVGERGVRLSGGQRQRIGIARALYNRPQVLIMDEATSSLDNITEKYIIDAIEQIRGDRTIIMIAHRLTTVQNCDRICMMKEGRIVSSGTYSGLLQNSPEFRKMSLVEEQ